MATYLRPGVYIEEIPSLPPSVIPVETAIPAFIGYTAPDDPNRIIKQSEVNLKPIKIFSMQEYEQYFGVPQQETTGITVTVKLDANSDFIAEEVIASINEINRSKHIMHYALQAYFLNGGGPCWVVSVGTYNNNISIPLPALEAGLNKIEIVDEVTIIVFPEALRMTNASRKTIYDAALQQCEKKKNRFLITDASPRNVGTPSKDIATIASGFRNNLIGYNYLKYSATYLPNVKTVLNYSIDDAAIDVTITSSSGVPSTVKLVALKTSRLTLYNLIRSKIDELSLVLPPSSLMAGIYTKVDQARGVFKAPANLSLIGVIAPTIKISDAEHDGLNIDSSGKSINAIRSFPGRGILVFGARTLDGNSNEWRYIPVRRFFSFAEISIKNTIEQFLFEPNDSNTWERVKAMIANFLTNQWQQGALVGDNPQQAFFVNVGIGSTMTPIDILEGKMKVEVGMAVVRPAEFIILRFSHLMQIS